MLPLELRLDVRARPQQAGENRGDFDPVLCHFRAEAVRKAGQCELARAVRREVRHGHLSADGRDIHDAPPALFEGGSAAVMSRSGPQK